jgi:HSP20 family protein
MNYLTRWQQPAFNAWQGLGRLTDLRDEIDRLFESPLAELTRTTQLLSGWTPAVDLFEDKDNFVIRAELPGMKKEDIDISLHGDVLTLSGERKEQEVFDKAETYRAERFLGRFQRSVTLPFAVDSKKVQASYRDGILNVTLPKTEEAKPKQIEVKVS